MTYKSGTKFMRARKLAEILATLPETAFVECNMVGNLRVSGPDGAPLGFVDLNDEVFEPFDPQI